MVCTRNILLSGAVVSNLFLGLYAIDERTRMLQRRDDISDTTPLTGAESKSIASMVKRGTLKLKSSLPSSKTIGKKGRSRRKLKSSKKEGPKNGPPPQQHSNVAGTSRTSPQRQSDRTGPPPHNGQPPAQTGRHHYYDYDTGDDTVGYVGDDTVGYVGDDTVGYVGDDTVGYVGDDTVGYVGDDTVGYIGDDTVGYNGYYDDYYYDDHYYDDDDGVGSGLVAMTMEGFHDSRTLQGAVLADPAQNEQAPGTVYLWNSEKILGVLMGNPNTNSTTPTMSSDDTYFVNEMFQLGTVSGKCTRIDVNSAMGMDYQGRSICQFVYIFLNQEGQEEAQLTAEGVVHVGVVSSLAMTGGTGIFRRASGQVLLYPVDVGAGSALMFNPIKDLPTSWYMQAFLWIQESLIPPEMEMNS